jgi:uncharacterized HAD superfamily protein
MRTIREFWNIQKEFNKQIIDFKNENVSYKTQMTKEQLLHLISEIDELLQGTGEWKIHKKFKNQNPRENVICEELVDMTKFIINIALIWNISPEKFVKEFKRKSMVNVQKFRQEEILNSLSKREKIAVFDLDGVICNYPENWLEFLNNKFYTSYRLNDVKDLELIAPEIPRKEYYEAKFEFRESGLEALSPKPIKYSKKVLEYLKRNGYTIVILSSRPYRKHKRLFADTIQWLNIHKIPFDCILWDENKEERIIKEIPNISFIVEDNPETVYKLSKIGNIKIYILDKPYNKNISKILNVKRIKKLTEIISDIGGKMI